MAGADAGGELGVEAALDRVGRDRVIDFGMEKIAKAQPISVSGIVYRATRAATHL